MEADWYLFAGDETALPAIARMLEQLPRTASAVVIVEVTDELEIQKLCCRARLETIWLLRRDGALGNCLKFEKSGFSS
ncbi:siderophore-interacting protein [Pseudorhizobium pelagicum]|uniref:siderophore-interacting protein n=1 Tax=Pseudorhizobium pelagicum TaxID=1509405 RepID=UPI001300C8AE|nr:siderophore-interacting protein [Pseudorhizobium pelagicum]